ncbi:MAG: SnoaL-like domain-containing protein [Planctomycetota bacterium]
MKHEELTARINELQDYIKTGRILEAMDEFYDESIAMQENANPPTVGLAENTEREKQFLAQIKEFQRYEPLAVTVGDHATAVESVMEFINIEGHQVKLEQVTVQRWNEAGKIVHERFYYDASGK